MDNFNAQVHRAINEAISEQVLPQLQAFLKTLNNRTTQRKVRERKGTLKVPLDKIIDSVLEISPSSIQILMRIRGMRNTPANTENQKADKNEWFHIFFIWGHISVTSGLQL